MGLSDASRRAARRRSAGAMHTLSAVTKRLRRAFFALIFVAAVIGVVWWMAQSEPAWYNPPDGTSEVVAGYADRVEYRLVEEMQKIRPVDDSWRLRIREDQVNAWLATRLERWMRHDANVQWPESLGIPQVLFRENDLSLAIPLGVGADGEDRHIIVASVRPEIVEGGLQAKLTSVGMGRITLPGSPVHRLASLIDEHLVEEDERFHSIVETALDVLSGEELLDPIIRLADDRCVEILKLELEESSFVVTARTLRGCDRTTLVQHASVAEGNGGGSAD